MLNRPMYDANGHEIILNDCVIIKWAGKLVTGRVIRIDEQRSAVKVLVGNRLHKVSDPQDVQVTLHWS